MLYRFPEIRRATGWLAVLAVALAGCTVGPDYRGAPAVARPALQASLYVRSPSQGVRSGPAPSRWWLALNDPQLNALIDAAFAHSPDLQQASDRVLESRAQLAQQHAAQLPKVSGDVMALRMREPDVAALEGRGASGAGGGSSSGRGALDFYSGAFDASWEADIFGGQRRAVESASATAQAVAADLADAQVSLAAEVAQAYIDLRDQQSRLALARQSAALQQQTLELIRQRRARGIGTDADVEQQQTQVQNTRANLIPLDEQITESLDQLAVLTGQPPGALDRQLAIPGALPRIPAEVLVPDPSKLLQQRPDIRAAERRLAASHAEIGQHIADLFPKVTLLGVLGSSGDNPGHLFQKSALTWIGAPYLQWDILDFGRIRSQIRQAKASRDEASAHYVQTVLQALQDANKALSRYGHQRDSVQRMAQIEASASHSAELMQQRYMAGASSLIDLLDAERSLYTAQQNRIQGQGELLKDFVSIQKSLGLGWQTP
ncbi:efflux transporter outer membrane subunit [Frateuria aurantia]